MCPDCNAPYKYTHTGVLSPPPRLRPSTPLRSPQLPSTPSLLSQRAPLWERVRRRTQVSFSPCCMRRHQGRAAASAVCPGRMKTRLRSLTTCRYDERARARERQKETQRETQRNTQETHTEIQPDRVIQKEKESRPLVCCMYVGGGWVSE